MRFLPFISILCAAGLVAGCETVQPEKPTVGIDRSFSGDAVHHESATRPPPKPASLGATDYSGNEEPPKRSSRKARTERQIPNATSMSPIADAPMKQSPVHRTQNDRVPTVEKPPVPVVAIDDAAAPHSPAPATAPHAPTDVSTPEADRAASIKEPKTHTPESKASESSEDDLSTLGAAFGKSF